MTRVHYLASIVMSALVTAACGAPSEEDSSIEIMQTFQPLYGDWHTALLTHRITNNNQSWAAEAYCGDSSKNMNTVNNTCMLPLPTGPTVAGINRATAAATLGVAQGPGLCNTCIEIKLGSRTVKGNIADECPECATNQIDVHCALYWDLYKNSGVTPSIDSNGRLTGAQWRLVPCASTGRRRYALKTGSGGGSWFALQVRNDPYLVSQFDVQPAAGGAWIAGQLDDNGFFVWNNLTRGGTYNVRINGTVVDVVKLPSTAVTNPTNQTTAEVTGQRDIGPVPPLPPPGPCTDTPPDSNYSCAQQKSWGKCGESWMQNYCNQSCGRCTSSTPPPPCTDNPPDANYTCAQQKSWGKCGESWMQNYCNRSCGRCS